MYNWVKPKAIIPVHGEHRHMMEHINFAKKMQVPYPVQIENGDIVQIYPGNEPHVVDKAPVGRMYVDGNISISEDSQSLKERKNLANNCYWKLQLLSIIKVKLLRNLFFHLEACLLNVKMMILFLILKTRLKKQAEHFL